MERDRQRQRKTERGRETVKIKIMQLWKLRSPKICCQQDGDPEGKPIL